MENNCKEQRKNPSRKKLSGTVQALPMAIWLQIDVSLWFYYEFTMILLWVIDGQVPFMQFDGQDPFFESRWKARKSNEKRSKQWKAIKSNQNKRKINQNLYKAIKHQPKSIKNNKALINSQSTSIKDYQHHLKINQHP